MQQTYDILTRGLTDAQRSRLDALLATVETSATPNGSSANHVGQESDAESRSRLERFKVPARRYAVLVCFLQAALAETADAIVDAQDKLITSIHSKARKRRDALLRAGEEAKRRAVEVLEVMGELVLDESIPDAQLRPKILSRISSEEMTAKR